MVSRWEQAGLLREAFETGMTLINNRPAEVAPLTAASEISGAQKRRIIQVILSNYIIAGDSYDISPEEFEDWIRGQINEGRFQTDVWNQLDILERSPRGFDGLNRETEG